jgi:hypothetical protein
MNRGEEEGTNAPWSINDEYDRIMKILIAHVVVFCRRAFVRAATTRCAPYNFKLDNINIHACAYY